MKYDLSRFKKAQEQNYAEALCEIQKGHKQSHWIWYIFPQIAGLGRSGTAEYYAIRDLGEAKAYLADDTLREHLLEISRALLTLESSDAENIMGWPDNLKLRSSITLFHEADPEEEVFQQVLDKFYGGVSDQRTLQILKSQA